MSRALRWCLAATLVSTGFATPALAASNATGGFSISVWVPEECDVAANSFVIDQKSGLVVGHVNEFCNHDRGFQVIASHRTLAESEAVNVTYGTATASLDPSGLSPIAFRAGARAGVVPVSISTIGLAAALQLSFSLTAV